MGIFSNSKIALKFIATRQICSTGIKPKHLICFKQWTTDMILEIIISAINLKKLCPDTHMQKLDVLTNAKILILEEVNEPYLFTAISKAATLLGAQEFSVVDKVLWDADYNGRVFSCMSDAIFVSTTTHACVQRLSQQSTVPVLCVKSRTHASIQSLAVVMTVMEHFGTMKNINVGYLGPPRQILNSLLLLCPMLGANIHFKCSCPVAKQSPLLLKMSTDMAEGTESKVIVSECTTKDKVLEQANVIIAGPTPKADKVKYFTLSVEDIEKKANDWIFIHCCPRGKEVDDKLFYSDCAVTFQVFQNLQYIAASLMAWAIKDHIF